MREEKTFRVVVFRFETDASTNYTRYMITKNYMPFFPGNQWLELKSIRKTSTGKEYAKKLVAFLNWLDSRKVTYENATNHHVREFLHELVFGNLADEKVLSLQASVGYSTLTCMSQSSRVFMAGWMICDRQRCFGRKNPYRRIALFCMDKSIHGSIDI